MSDYAGAFTWEIEGDEFIVIGSGAELGRVPLDVVADNYIQHLLYLASEGDICDDSTAS